MLDREIIARGNRALGDRLTFSFLFQPAALLKLCEYTSVTLSAGVSQRNISHRTLVIVNPSNTKRKRSFPETSKDESIVLTDLAGAASLHTHTHTHTLLRVSLRCMLVSERANS